MPVIRPQIRCLHAIASHRLVYVPIRMIVIHGDLRVIISGTRIEFVINSRLIGVIYLSKFCFRARYDIAVFIFGNFDWNSDHVRIDQILQLSAEIRRIGEAGEIMTLAVSAYHTPRHLLRQPIPVIVIISRLDGYLIRKILVFSLFMHFPSLGIQVVEFDVQRAIRPAKRVTHHTFDTGLLYLMVREYDCFDQIILIVIIFDLFRQTVVQCRNRRKIRYDQILQTVVAVCMVFKPIGYISIIYSVRDISFGDNGVSDMHSGSRSGDRPIGMRSSVYI